MLRHVQPAAGSVMAVHCLQVLVAEAWCPVSGKQQVQDALSESAQRANSSVSPALSPLEHVFVSLHIARSPAS